MQWYDVVDALSELPIPAEALFQIDLARVEAVGPPAVGIGVRALRRHAGARTVGDVAVDPALVAGVLEHGLGRDDRRAFMRSFVDAVREALATDRRAREAAAPIAPAARPRTPAPNGAFDIDQPPAGGDALEAWAAHFGVTDAFEVRLHVAPPGGKGRRRGSSMPEAPLRHWLDLERYPSTGVAFGYPRDALRAAAAKEIVVRAYTAAPLAGARRAYLARRAEPADAWLAERVRAFRSLLDTTPADAHEVYEPPLAHLYPAARVVFEPKPPVLTVFLSERHGGYRVDVATGKIRDAFYGDSLVAPRAPNHRAAIASAADALCDPESSAAKELLTWRATPPWQHALAEFEARLAKSKGSTLAGDGDGERVVFHVDEARVLPAILAQKPKKTGGFSAGRAVDAYRAVRIPGLSPVELEILQLTTVLERSVYANDAYETLSLRLLELLAEHPRVVVGPNKMPVRVRRVRPALRVAADPATGGYRLELVVGATVLDPIRANERVVQRTLRLHEEAAGTFWFAPLDDTTRALVEALAVHPIALPNDGLDGLLARLGALPELAVDLDLPEEARGKAVSGDARPVVRLALGESLSISIRVKPLGVAVHPTAHVPGAPPRHVYGSDASGARVFATRDLDDEECRAESVLAALPLAGAIRKDGFDAIVDDPDRACDVVATLHDLGDSIVVEWEQDQRLRVAGSAATRSLQLRITRRKDWFGIEGGVEADGEVIPLLALLDAVRGGRRFVRLEGGRLLAIERDLRARLRRLDDAVQRARGGELVVHPPALHAVAAVVADEDAQISAAAEWHALRDRVRRARDLEPAPPPVSAVRAELRGYQLDGYKWLMRLAACDGGACLADDMGLGKTLQSLAVLHARKDEGPALVVAPTSVGANWVSEAARFVPELQVVEHRGAGRGERLEWLGPGHVLVTSYDILVRDAGDLAEIPFATAIFDEAHAIKNPLSKRAEAARAVRARFRIALTGTPVENHTSDLWSIFRTVVPGLFGSWEDFRERFAMPIERDKDAARREALATMVRPYLLRRTKREVSPELPPRTEIVRLVDPSPAERELYERERAAIVSSLAAQARPAAPGAGGATDGRFAMLAALTRLRQLACHPRLRDPDAPPSSAKLEAVLALVDELREGGHKALVFSQFTSHLAIVAEALRARGATFFELDGGTPAEARADRVRRFQAGEAELFLVSLKAGGVGLNLTAADYVLHLDPWWNPAAEDQASDRAHRIGQDKPVTVVRFVTKGTIEEAVLELHAEKRDLADAILAGGDVAARMSTRELFALIEQRSA